MSKEKKITNNKKKNKRIRLVSRLIWLVGLVFTGILIYFVIKANVLPNKYLYLIIAALALIKAVVGLFIWKKNTRIWLLIILSILSIAYMAGETFAILKIDQTLEFINRNLASAEYETNIYNIVVNKDSNVSKFTDIDGKEVSSYKDLGDNQSLLETALRKKTNYASINYEEDIVSLMESIKEDKEKIILVNSGNYEAMTEVDETFASSVKVIDSVEVKTKVQSTETGIDVTQDAFVVYLQGIDTRSGTLPSRSLSDVNIIMAVNPTTHNILMVHIPRDYYVQIHGQTGLKDKLTHSGTYGGVTSTMQTIEDLLEIKIPYYVRVNFNSVERLVDAIGGITVNSDVNYDIKCWTNNSCIIKPGLNDLDGKCALAFARERKAYSTGDRHRGENQEQVIEKVITKLTSSSTLLSSYDSLLNALNGTFETNFQPQEITSLIKMELEDMAKWTIETYNVTGTGAMMPTHAYPNLNLYVMQPDMTTVTTAVSKLDEILGTKGN